MPAVTIRNLPPEIHQALKLRAVRNGRSTEAEIRFIIEQAVHPYSQQGLGSALAEIGRRLGGIEIDLTREKTPAVPISLE